MDSLTEDLFRELECPVCKGYMVPPIVLCEKGHNICSNCKPRLNKCPNCKRPFSNIRNVTLENLASKVQYPCRYKEYGCKRQLLLDFLVLHQEICPYKPSFCPFLKFELCSWKGSIDRMKGHVKNHTGTTNTHEFSGEHTILLCYFTRSSEWFKTLVTLDAVFLLYSKRIGNFLYNCVLCIDHRDKACNFKYKITLNRVCGPESVTTIHLTRSHLANVEEVLKSGDCAVFHTEFAKKCMNNEGALPLAIEISVFTIQ